MSDFFEIDFLDVESDKSGDAIAMRYCINGKSVIHVTDGGYLATGAKLVEHIRRYYGNPSRIDYVVVTHSDGDHTSGLKEVLESFDVGELWMHQPWLYAEILIPQFKRFSSVDNLRSRLKDIYSNFVQLEEIAIRRQIPIRAPFQGQKIGAFTVMSPSLTKYLGLILESEKTPEPIKFATPSPAGLAALFSPAPHRATTFLKSGWGSEVFSDEETSAENEMSVVQYAMLNGKKILLTGDAGRGGLAEAIRFAPCIGLSLPGIDKFQVPHHGSRRNVSSDLLDLLLGPRLRQAPKIGDETFTAIISSAEADEDHPRKSVVRAMIHRGAKVISTEGNSIRSQCNAPKRNGWCSITPMPYPANQES